MTSEKIGINLCLNPIILPLRTSKSTLLTNLPLDPEATITVWLINTGSGSAS